MNTFRVWSDFQSEDYIEVVANDPNEAFDKACESMGFIDQADYMQSEGMDVSDLNVKLVG